ncbi:unnamed protein product [Blepharisma stoltei]|uniref:PAS domain-containing protein n=1 Tax=Blepharisma stoltei TaxID=1481888 RepID=A0AAU9IU99_9CILI|nr:unnamed protein product [Blepharisma stoltei]
MSKILKSNENEAKDLHKFLSQSLFSSRFKNYFYSFFGQLFKVHYNRNTRPSLQLSCEIFINAVYTLQVISLAWHPNMWVKGWSSYNLIWYLIGWASYDSICVGFDIMNFCFYGTISLISMCLVSFTVFGIFIYLKKNPPAYISFWTRKIAVLLTTYSLIPSTLILLVVAKYSIIDARTVDEYGGLTASTLNFGLLGVFSAVFGLVVLISINFYLEYFSCDINHSNPEKNIKSRSHSLLDLQIRLFYFLSCVSFVLFINEIVYIHQSFLFCYSIFVCYKSLTVLQYFNVLENIIVACKLSMISSTLSFFIFGELLNSATIIIVFAVFLQPAIFLITIKLVKRNYKKLGNNIGKPSNQFEFERKFRHLLTDKDCEDKFMVLNLFKNYWNANQFRKDKIFVIWEFNYCLFIIKDERLARVKLSKIANAENSLEGEIQEWRIFTWPVNRNCKAFPETSYLEFLKEYSRIRNEDEELCYAIIELQIEISLKAPRINKIVNLANRTTNYVKSLSRDFKALVEKYKNIEGFELYESFLENISNNHEEAGIINRKKNGLKINSQFTDIKNIENYGKDVPLLLVSCFDCNIMYLNEKASLLLKSSIGNVIGTSLLNFIPHPFDSCHLAEINDYVLSSSTIELASHRHLFIQNAQRYLIECNFLIKLVAFHNSAYFLITFEQRKLTREIAITSEDGFIIGHSEHFPYYAGSTSKSLIGKILSAEIPGLDINKMKAYEPWRVLFNSEEILFIKMKKQIKSTTINKFIIIHDAYEIKNWKEELDEDQLINFAEQDSDFNTEKYKLDEIRRSSIKNQFLSPTSMYLLQKSSNEAEIYSNEIKITSRQNEDKKLYSDDYSKSSAGHKLSNEAKSLLLESKRKIKVLQIVLFLVVFSGVVTMAAILGYMIIDVSLATSLSSFKNIGQLLYDLGMSYDQARNIDSLIMSNPLNQPIDTYAANLERVNVELEDVQKVIFEKFDQWKYCKSAEIVTNPTIPLVYFDSSEPKAKYLNLYDAISEIILNVISI